MASFTLVDSSTAAAASSNTSPVHVPEIDCAPLSPMQEGVEGMEMLSYLLGTDVIKSEFSSAGSPAASYDSESESGDEQMSRTTTTTTTMARKGGRSAAASKAQQAAASSSAAAAAGRNDPGRNARMAKENRERKKQYISGLEGTIEQLKSEIKRLNADKAAMAKQLATAAVEIDTLKVTLNNQQALNPFFQALQTIPGLCLAGAPLASSDASAGSKRSNNNNNNTASSSSAKSSRSKRAHTSNDDDDDSVNVSSSSSSAAAPVTIPLLLNIQLIQPPK